MSVENHAPRIRIYLTGGHIIDVALTEMNEKRLNWVDEEKHLEGLFGEDIILYARFINGTRVMTAEVIQAINEDKEYVRQEGPVDSSL